MEERIRQLINQLPTKPFRSKLEPHLDLIRELRQKRLSYQEIAQFLAAHLHLNAAPSTIHAFIHVRARRSRQSAPAVPVMNEPNQSPPVQNRTTTSRRVQPDKPRFEYVEGKPLTLIPDRKD